MGRGSGLTGMCRPVNSLGPLEDASTGAVRYYSLARFAFLEALRLWGVGQGQRVLLPSFICRDLLAPITILGATPCWYEVTAGLIPSGPPESWPDADAVLAVNYFGFPQYLQSFKDYAERTGAVVIEDNAHGYLSRDQTGQWLGCRTGLGIFSLRKTLRIPDGGALWVGAEYAARELPAQAAFSGTGINSAELTKIRLRGLPAVGELAFQLSTGLVRALRKWRTGRKVPAADPASERVLLAPANPWAGLLPALAACAAPAEIERRRAFYIHCEAVGRQVGALPVFSALPPLCAPYGYAFRGDATAQVGMRRYAERHGFDLVSWPDLPTQIVSKVPPHYKDVFVVNFLW